MSPGQRAKRAPVSDRRVHRPHRGPFAPGSCGSAGCDRSGPWIFYGAMRFPSHLLDPADRAAATRAGLQSRHSQGRRGWGHRGAGEAMDAILGFSTLAIISAPFGSAAGFRVQCLLRRLRGPTFFQAKSYLGNDQPENASQSKVTGCRHLVAARAARRSTFLGAAGSSAGGAMRWLDYDDLGHRMT